MPNRYTFAFSHRRTGLTHVSNLQPDYALLIWAKLVFEIPLSTVTDVFNLLNVRFSSFTTDHLAVRQLLFLNHVALSRYLLDWLADKGIIQDYDCPVPFVDGWLEHLRSIESEQNEGRGVSCVRTLISFMDRNSWREALAVFRNEFDKIRNYPKIASHLGILGFRL
jgi:hypothetical protein